MGILTKKQLVNVSCSPFDSTWASRLVYPPLFQSSSVLSSPREYPKCINSLSSGRVVGPRPLSDPLSKVLIHRDICSWSKTGSYGGLTAIVAQLPQVANYHSWLPIGFYEHRLAFYFLEASTRCQVKEWQWKSRTIIGFHCDSLSFPQFP